MKPTHRRARLRLCPTCDRLVYLNSSGLYRRHYAAERHGRRHLCAGSGREFGRVVQSGELRGRD
jgi:hypothetical protein